MSKVIIILSDALRYDTAVEGMGFLGHIVANSIVHLSTKPNIRPDHQGLGDTGKTVSHLQIVPTVLQMLELPIPKIMKQPPIP